MNYEVAQDIKLHLCLERQLKIEAAKVENAEKEMHLKERELQAENEKWKEEQSKFREEKRILNRKLEEGIKSLERKCENLTRENEELKKKTRKESNLLTEVIAHVAAVGAKRGSGDQSLSLPGGSEDELNNEPPSKYTKYV